MLHFPFPWSFALLKRSHLLEAARATTVEVIEPSHVHLPLMHAAISKGVMLHFFRGEPQMRFVQALFVVALAIGTSSTALAAGRFGYPACKDKTIMSRALDLSDQSDYQAAYVILQRGMKSKDCQVIPANELVIETTPPLSRLVKVHRRGDPDEYWIIN